MSESSAKFAYAFSEYDINISKQMQGYFIITKRGEYSSELISEEVSEFFFKDCIKTSDELKEILQIKNTKNQPLKIKTEQKNEPEIKEEQDLTQNQEKNLKNSAQEDNIIAPFEIKEIKPKKPIFEIVDVKPKTPAFIIEENKPKTPAFIIEVNSLKNDEIKEKQNTEPEITKQSFETNIDKSEDDYINEVLGSLPQIETSTQINKTENSQCLENSTENLIENSVEILVENSQYLENSAQATTDNLENSLELKNENLEKDLLENLQDLKNSVKNLTEVLQDNLKNSAQIQVDDLENSVDDLENSVQITTEIQTDDLENSVDVLENSVQITTEIQADDLSLNQTNQTENLEEKINKNYFAKNIVFPNNKIFEIELFIGGYDELCDRFYFSHIPDGCEYKYSIKKGELKAIFIGNLSADEAKDFIAGFGFETSRQTPKRIEIYINDGQIPAFSTMLFE